MRLPGNALPKMSSLVLAILAALSITVSIVQTCHVVTDRPAINSSTTNYLGNSTILAGSSSESRNIPGVCVGVVSLILLVGRKYLMPIKAKSKSLVENFLSLRRPLLFLVQKYSFTLTLPQLGVSRT